MLESVRRLASFLRRQAARRDKNTEEPVTLEGSPPPSGATLLRRFTILSLVLTAILGGLLGETAARVAAGYVLRRHAHAAAVYVSEFAAPRLVTEDFLLPSRRIQFEFAFRGLIGKAGIVRVIVWDRQGQILYSDDATLIGHTFPVSPPLREALAGRVRWRFASSGRQGESQFRRMEVFVPVFVKDTAPPIGAYQTLSDLTDLDPTLFRVRWSMRAGVVLGVLLLYLMLYTIVRDASRDLARQHQTLKQAYEGIVASLVSALDARDMATAHHSHRVADYAEATAREMQLGDNVIRQARIAGYLHDIGKIGVSDNILTKRGRLYGVQRKKIREHPVFGYEILRPVPVPEEIKLAVRHSHERWDGRGYPDGLAGSQIPIVARIVAVADAYEALTTDRPYRTAQTSNQAIEAIKGDAGTQFDPQVVETFVQLLQQPHLISRELQPVHTD